MLRRTRSVASAASIIAGKGASMPRWSGTPITSKPSPSARRHRSTQLARDVAAPSATPNRKSWTMRLSQPAESPEATDPVVLNLQVQNCYGVHMPRPMTFDPDAATDAAMQVFWRQGYAGATPATLEAAMGIGRSSLYNSFGSKQQLYLRALDHYVREESRQVVDILAAQGPVLPRLRAVIDHVVALSLRDAEHRGCLVTNAAIDRARDDDAVRALLQRVVDEQTAAFADAIEAGRRTGEIAAGVDAAATAGLLVAALNGIRVLARIDPSEERLAALADAALRGLAPDAP